MNRPTWRAGSAPAHTLCAAIAAAACGLAPSVARAEGPVQGEQIAQARVLGNEGIKRAEAGDCAGAIPKLEGAEQLFHAPTTLEWLGECLVKTGKIVAGTEALIRAAHETLPPNAPPQFVAAQERAKAALPAAQARIGQLIVHVLVDGAAASAASVAIDGVALVAAMLDTERPTDPGPHELRATAQGFEPATATVTLADGEHKRVELHLVPSAAPPPAATPAPAPAPEATPAEPPPPPPAAPPPPGAPNRTPAYVAYGVGGVGLVVGAVFGVMALGTKSTLTDACNPKTNCPASSQSDIDSLSTKAWVANGGFAVAILGAGIGTYLWLTADDAPKPASTGVRVTPYLAGTTAGLTASF
jgi:hypothetical protein